MTRPLYYDSISGLNLGSENAMRDLGEYGLVAHSGAAPIGAGLYLIE
jgi:hypothetical protein